MLMASSQFYIDHLLCRPKWHAFNWYFGVCQRGGGISPSPLAKSIFFPFQIEHFHMLIKNLGCDQCSYFVKAMLCPYCLEKHFLISL